MPAAPSTTSERRRDRRRRVEPSRDGGQLGLALEQLRGHAPTLRGGEAPRQPRREKIVVAIHDVAAGGSPTIDGPARREDRPWPSRSPAYPPPPHATVASAFLDTVARTPRRRRRPHARRRARAAPGRSSPSAWPPRPAACARSASGAATRSRCCSTNRPELWVADLAVTMCGATTCPLYTTLPPNDIEYVVARRGRAGRAGRAELRAAAARRARGVEQSRRMPGRSSDARALEARGEPVDLAAAAAALDPAAIIDADLHVGDHRAAEGRRAHARRRDGVGRAAGGRARRSPTCGGSSRGCRRARDGPRAALLAGAGQGLRDHDVPRPARDRALPDRGAPAPADRRPARVGEAQGGRRGGPGGAARRAPRRRRGGDRRRASSACGCARPAPPVPADLEAARRPAPTPRCSPACASGSGSTSWRWPAPAPRRSRATCSSSSTPSASTCARATRCRRPSCLGASAGPGARRSAASAARSRASSSGSPPTARSSCAARR